MQARYISVAMCLCVTLSGTLIAPETLAQSAAQALDQAKADARAAADRGQALYDQGSYEEAISAFQEAEQKFHAPTFLLMIARAYEKRGRLLKAREYYRQVVEENLANYAPAVFFEAQAEAKKELGTLTPRIPTILVTVTGAPTSEISLTVDRQPVVPGAVLELDPGEHSISVTAPGREALTHATTLQEGGKAHVALELKAPPLDPATPAIPPPRRTTPLARPPQPIMRIPKAPAEVARGRLSNAPAIVAFGVASVGLTAGLLTGGIALLGGGALGRDCYGSRCPDDGSDQRDKTVRALTTASVVSFVVSGISAVAGTVLILSSSRDDVQTSASLRLAPGWVGMHGRF